MPSRPVLLAAAAFLLGAAASFSQPAPQDAPAGAPEAVIDLATPEGIALVGGGPWRTRDASIVETEFPGPGADNQPTGPAG